MWSDFEENKADLVSTCPIREVVKEVRVDGCKEKGGVRSLGRSQMERKVGRAGTWHATQAWMVDVYRGSAMTGRKSKPKR